MNLSFSSFNDNIKVRVNEGVYYFEGTPIYFIEHVEEDFGEFVLVYDIHDRKNTEKPEKKYHMEKHKPNIQGGTFLSNIIQDRIDKSTKTKYKRVVEEPIFIAQIIQLGIDTVTGKTGKGFFERRKDELIMSSKGNYIKHGDYTGVFIGLESIKWIKSYTPLEDVIKQYKQQKEDNLGY